MTLQIIHKSNEGRWALLKIFIGAVMISFSGVWVKVSHVTPIVSAFYRVFWGSLFLLIAAAMRREIQWLGSRHFGLGLLCGMFFALDLICYHYSIHYVGPGLGTILPNLQVFILAIIGVLFLKEKLDVRTIICAPIAFAGLWLIVGPHWNQQGTLYQAGIAFGLIAAIFYSLFLLSLRKLQAQQRGMSIFYVLMMVSLTTTALIAPTVPLTQDAFTIPDFQSLWALLALGLLSQCIGWILITNALPHLRASLSGLILLLQPALAFVWDVLLFHRVTGLMNWAGVLLVLGAIYFAASAQTPQQE